MHCGGRCCAVLHCHDRRPSGDACTLLLPSDVEYTLARSRYKFDDLEAYMATAYSVRGCLLPIMRVDPVRHVCQKLVADLMIQGIRLAVVEPSIRICLIEMLSPCFITAATTGPRSSD